MHYSFNDQKNYFLLSVNTFSTYWLILHQFQTVDKIIEPKQKKGRSCLVT